MKNKKKSLGSPKNTGSADGNSTARLVITNTSGRQVASAPALQLTPNRFHLRKILVPVDFSPNCQESILYARHFAEQFEAEICLLHVVEPVVVTNDFGYVPILPNDLEEQRLEGAGKELRTLAKSLGAGVAVESKVLLGRAWKEITDAARTLPADLLIVSTHGFTRIKHALLGSVAEKIVRHAPCPVLVVRLGEHEFV
jgi:nucleotide-binding universal stress UspA family protein